MAKIQDCLFGGPLGAKLQFDDIWTVLGEKLFAQKRVMADGEFASEIFGWRSREAK